MNKEQLKTTKKFIKFCKEKLELKSKIKLLLTSDREKYGIQTYAYFNPETEQHVVYMGHRSLADILRSIAHEMVHCKQKERGELNKPIQDIGGKEEDEANALAGRYVKEFGYENQEIFESKMIKMKNLLLENQNFNGWEKQKEWYGNPSLGLESYKKMFHHITRNVPVYVFGKGNDWSFTVAAGANSDYSYTGGFPEEIRGGTVEDKLNYVDTLYVTKRKNGTNELFK